MACGTSGRRRQSPSISETGTRYFQPPLLLWLLLGCRARWWNNNDSNVIKSLLLACANTYAQVRAASAMNLAGGSITIKDSPTISHA